MAIRQEEYTIYVRPHISKTINGEKVSIFADKKTELYTRNPQAVPSDPCPYIPLVRNAEDDYWVGHFTSNSLEQIRAKYNELIETIGEENIKVGKQVPMGYIVVPQQ